MKRMLLILSIMMLFIASCSKKEEKITIILDYTPNTNHTGLYVALDKGYFSAEGVDVEIIQPGDSYAVDKLVASGKYEFGVSFQETVTRARANGSDIVSVAALLQHNTSCFVSLAKDSIITPADFLGKKYGSWGDPMEAEIIKSLMIKEGVDHEDITIELQYGDILSSLGKECDFKWIFYGWDGIAAQLKGVELNYIWLKEQNEALDYYTPILITSQKLIDSNSEMVSKVLKAIEQGYADAISNPKEGADILLKYAPGLDSELVHKSQEYLSKEYIADAPMWGHQEAKRWELYMNWMLEKKQLSGAIDVNSAFTNEFLKGYKK